MSLVSVFVDAFKKAAGRKPEIDIDTVRSSGGLGSTVDTGGFDPLRPAPTSGQGSEVSGGDLTVKSSDPEEGGEVAATSAPSPRTSMFGRVVGRRRNHRS